MTVPMRIDTAVQTGCLAPQVADFFSDDRAAGTVIGTCAAGGAIRLGCDVERQIAIDHGALRFQPLITPGWQRQGIAYGPFRRQAGLVMAVSITNGHNTSQGSSIPEHILKRFYRWAVGPNTDPWPRRLVAWARAPRKKATLRRFLWWIRSTSRTYKLPNHNENLAIGWFSSEAPKDPLVDGCGLVMHAAEGENGELWARVGNRCLSAFRQLKNIEIHYLIALRESGAVYYAAAMDGARGMAAVPMMRPIAIDPFNSDALVYAGVHQCVLGQIGFRVDTRVHAIQIQQLEDFARPFGTAHAGDSLSGNDNLEDMAELGGIWRVLDGNIHRTVAGALTRDDHAMAILDAGASSGLIHVLVDTGQAAAAAGLVWRARDRENFWLLKVSVEGCDLLRVEQGVETAVASDKQRRLKPNSTHSLQVLDAHGQVGCYLDGDRLFDRWFESEFLEDATCVGIWLNGGELRLRNFEAHPRAVSLPSEMQFDAPWLRFGEDVEYADDFAGVPGGLAGRAPSKGTHSWERTLGVGFIDVDGMGAARVRGTRESPDPGRSLYTLPWDESEFADLEVTITPPGSARGQHHYCRAGLVFWQDDANYLTFTAYLDDVYDGASIALFTKRHDFEELYDAVWTMLWKKIDWGKPFQLRIVFDGERFVVFVDGEPVMQRTLTDIYPDDPRLRITRVGLATNWEWGTDTGSVFSAFTARR